MKRLKLSTILFVLLSLTYSCNQPAEKPVETTEVEVTQVTAEPEAAPIIDVDAIVASIDQKRTEIETSIQEPIEISTADLREKTKQKWEKIHFYTQEGEVVRIKAYPHEGISNRTEEFYLDGKSLILVVIEDNGMGAKGKTSEEIDKLYYFNDDEIIKEDHSNEEIKYGIKNSDGEELLGEVHEYLDMFTSLK